MFKEVQIGTLDTLDNIKRQSPGCILKKPVLKNFHKIHNKASALEALALIMLCWCRL